MTARMILHVLALVFATALIHRPATVRADTALTPTRFWTTPTPFVGENPEGSTDLSGIACLPAGNGARTCIVIDDQLASAQIARLEDGKMVAGPVLGLLGGNADPQTLGRAPTGTCRKRDDFKDLDGEAVAYRADGGRHVIYIAGSHGCGRNSHKFRLSSFLLARYTFDASGALLDHAGKPVASDALGTFRPETTYRLADALMTAQGPGAYFARMLEAQNGLNLEGLAIVGDKLIAGLRGPTLEDNAFLIRIGLAELFAPGHEPLTATPEVIPLALGPGRGVRDLAVLADGRLLVLAGPATAQQVPYEFVVADPDGRRPLARIGTIAPVRDGSKPEGIAVLDQATDGTLVVLVLDDSAPNGGPREFRLTLPK